MGWIAWIVMGGLAGWVASLLTKNSKNMGIIMNIVVGIVGAFVGSWIIGLLGITETLTFSVPTFLVAVGGAVVLLFLVNLIRGAVKK